MSKRKPNLKHTPEFKITAIETIVGFRQKMQNKSDQDLLVTLYKLFKSEQSVDKGVCFSADRLNHVATIAIVAEELCSSVFQWGINPPTEKLNGTLPPIGGGPA